MPAEKRLEVLRGEVWVALFEKPEGGLSRSDFFPGDEFVYVLSGAVTLTNARSSEAVSFGPGEHFLVPKGWRGTWASEPDYREVAVCSAEWLSPYRRAFHPGTIDPQRRDAVLAIDIEAARDRWGPPSRDGVRSAHLHGGDVLVQVHAAGTERGPVTSELRSDAFVHVLEGHVTLAEEAGGEETFGPNDCFVVTRGFAGTWHRTSDYVAVMASAGS